MTSDAVTSVQQQAWIDSLNGASGARAISLLVRISGAADPDLVHEALRDIVRRHDALRMSFEAGRPDRCVVVHPADAQVEFDVAEHWPAPEALQEYLTRPFPLTGSTRLRVRLVPEPDGRYRLALSADHLAMDFVSLRRMFAQLRRPTPAAPQYSAFAALQRERMAGEWGAVRRRFWLRYFDTWGAAHPPTPVARPAPATGGRTIRRRVGFDRAFNRTLESVSAAHGTTAFAVVAAAVLLTQLRWRDDPTAGIVTDFHGRVLGAAVATVGLFSHGTRVHLSAHESDDMCSAVRAVSAKLAEVRQYSIPLRLLVAEWCGHRGVTVPSHPYVYVCGRPPKGSPVSIQADGFSIDDVALRTAANEAGRDLSIILDDDATLNVRYSSKYFRPEDVDRFVDAVLDAVRSAGESGRCA